MPKCITIAEVKRGDVKDGEFTVYTTDDRRVELCFETDQSTFAVVLPWDALRKLVSGLTKAAGDCGASL